MFLIICLIIYLILFRYEDGGGILTFPTFQREKRALRLVETGSSISISFSSGLSQPNQYRNDVVDCFSRFSVPPFSSRTPPLDFPPVFPQFVSS
ncbi:hypothetical protein ACFX15_000571 [Malus domestica]